MKLHITALVLALGSTAALAGPTCNVPEEKWMKEADFKAGLEKQGYQIRTFKVSKGTRSAITSPVRFSAGAAPTIAARTPPD